jgi:hypothetical protein
MIDPDTLVEFTLNSACHKLYQCSRGRDLDGSEVAFGPG